MNCPGVSSGLKTTIDGDNFLLFVILILIECQLMLFMFKDIEMFLGINKN